MIQRDVISQHNVTLRIEQYKCSYYCIIFTVESRYMQKNIPQSHDMPVSTETGNAVSSGHLHNISPQHEGGLCDVVFVDTRLGGHGHHFGLFLRTQHSKLGILTLL